MMQPRPPPNSSSRRSASNNNRGPQASSSSRSASSTTMKNSNSKAALGSTSNTATIKKSERQTRREQRQQDEAAAVAATSAALLDSVVPSKLIDSAAAFVLSHSPRIFGFHNRHMTSIRHPFFTMLSSESSSNDGGNNNEDGTNGDGENEGNNNNEENAKSSHHHQNTRNSSRTRSTGRAVITRKDGGLHRGGTNNVSTAHVSAVDNALKARRRSWQTLPEYLVERFSDISSGYPIELERWKQTAYMFDSILLEDDLVRRRKDILENANVVRALEACWTSWGGTTSSGIDFDTYRDEHLRLFQTLMSERDNTLPSSFDQAFMITVFTPSIEKDWNIDKEVAASGSAVRRMNSQNPSFRQLSPSRLTNRSENSVNTATSPAGGRNTNSRESYRIGEKSFSSRSFIMQQNDQQQQFQVIYEVPFRKFCVAMLELADNWARLRIGEQAAQVFAKFLMKVVLSPNNNSRNAKKKKQQQEEQQQELKKKKEQQREQNKKRNDDVENENEEEDENEHEQEEQEDTSSNTSKDNLRRFSTPITTSSIPPSMAYASILLEKERKMKSTAIHQQQNTNNHNPLGGNFEVINYNNSNSGKNSPTQQEQQNIFPDNNSSDARSKNRSPVAQDDEKNNRKGEVEAENEWKKICQTLKKRAFVHRGGPVIRMIPPECPGVPATYAALPKTKDEKFEDDDEEAEEADDEVHSYSAGSSSPHQSEGHAQSMRCEGSNDGVFS